MTSQLITPENARVCSVSGFLPSYLLWLTQGLICHAKFHFDRFKVSPLWDEKLKNWPASKLYHFALCAMLAITRNQKYHLNWLNNNQIISAHSVYEKVRLIMIIFFNRD